MIGYLCAYLRYYYPAEFITAYLNNANNDDDIKNGSALAELYGVQIVPPRFGLSKDRYIYDKEQNVIAKGIESIKYMNRNVANELYQLSKESKPKTFMELLQLMDQKTSLDTRQREILIKLDYFKDYGNVSELSRILACFALFKNGTAKKIQKDKLSGELLNITAAHGVDKNKDGSESKSYTITDMPGLLADCEKTIRTLNLPDIDYRVKIQNQLELLGYVDLTTNRKEDRKTLLVTDVYPMKSKTTGDIWGYAVQVRSIGTGKTARLTVRASCFARKPLKKLDIVRSNDIKKNDKGYWYMYDYEHVA